MKTATTQLSAGDAEILTWFFGPGLVEFERSITGALLDRAELFAMPSDDCECCGGSGWVRVKVAICGHCDRGWNTPKGKPSPRIDDTVEDPFCTVAHEPTKCAFCNGTSVEQIPEHSTRDGWVVDETCPECHGRGVQGAKRKHASWDGQMKTPQAEVFAPREPDEQSLARYGVVMRRLPYVSEQTARVLYAFYGIGTAWQTRYGRHWPVMALTQTGRRLLKKYRSKRPKNLPGEISPKDWKLLTQPELFAKLTELPDTEIPKSVWATAKEQAEELVQSASCAWIAAGLKTATSGDLGPRRPPRRRKQAPKEERFTDTQVRRITNLSRYVIEFGRAA